MNKKIIIIDGNSLIHRAYHGMRPLTNKEGEYTHGVYGFLRMLENLIKEEKPDGLGVAFDVGKTFRHDQYEDYKAGRKETDPELKSQFPLLKDALTYMGIPVLTAEGFEADDILGTVSRLGTENGDQVILITGDKDAFQLINSNTTLYLTRKGLSDIEKLDEAALFEKYGFTPAQAPDIKGLQGDSSDNIKGVFGIGAKNALNLVSKYGSLEGIYEHIEELKGKLKENLIAGREDAFFSRELGTIHKEVPIDYNHLEYSLEQNGNKAKLIELFNRLEFKNVFRDYVTEEAGDLDAAGEEYRQPLLAESLDDFLEQFAAIGAAAVSLWLDIDHQDIRGIQVYDGVTPLEYQPHLVSHGETNRILEAIAGRQIRYSLYDTKSVYHLFLNNGREIGGLDFEDLSLLAYVIYPERKYTLENFFRDILGSEGEPRYYSQYLDIAENILRQKSLEENVLKVYEDIEKPLSPILALMEHHGIGLDRELLKEMEKEVLEKIGHLKNKIWAIAGEEFNINSTQQLGLVLFEKLKLPAWKKTKTGYSTNQEVLDKLYDKHEIVPLILEYRKLTKLYSTYIDGLLQVTRYDRIIHTTYNQTVAVTGRLSSENPNLQNIPVRMTEGRLIRKAFGPVEEGNLLLCADYSQIELRILAHMSGDEGLIEAFQSGMDIHRKTASEVFDVPYEEVDSSLRRAAKAVNFGIIYGLSDFGLARDLGIEIPKAKDYIEKYFLRYPKIRSWIDSTILDAKESLKVYTLTGRYRLLPELKSSQFMVRSAAERMAMNAPIQGTAADLIKIAMIHVQDRLEEERLASKLMLQVHDELILEVPPKEMERVKELVREEMAGAMELKVPLIVDLKVGGNWFDVEEV